MATNKEGSAIAFPFSVNGSGSISYVLDDQTIYQNRVRIVLLTNLTERLMRPDFGTRLASLSFENITTVSSLAEQIVQNAFATFLPYLTLNSTFATSDLTNGGVFIQVNYTTPQGLVETVTAKTATLNRYGEIVQGA